MPKQSHNPELRRAFLEVVENQLREGKPPETRLTLERLMADGYSRGDAINLIACVVSSEILDVLNNNQPFQEHRYVAGLKSLPRLPWDDETNEIND